MAMEYVKKVWTLPLFADTLRELEQLEADRSYCRHGLPHLMDVARLAALENLEQGYGIEQEQIYLAALLHDLGRVEEYKQGISHAKAGSLLAGEILVHIGYPKEKQELILCAIEGHRSKQSEDGDEAVFANLIRRADKKSRPCFWCEASDSCKWEREKRNSTKDWR